MPHNCRTHCPSGGHGTILRDLLLLVVGLSVFYWLAGKAAPVADAGMTRVAVVVAAAAAVVVVSGVAWLVVRRVLNRRALARYAVLEQQAQEQATREPEPRALTEAACALEAAPTVRAQARVEREPEREAA